VIPLFQRYKLKSYLGEMKDLLLIGGGGHCKAVIDVAECAGYKIIGIIDRKEKVGKVVLDYPIIGTDEDIPLFVDKAEFLITVGFVTNPSLRISLYNKVKESGGDFATIVSPTSYVSKNASIGKGSIIMHKAVVSVGAKIGCNCIVNTMADVDHCVEIGDHTHLSANVLIAGDSKVGDRCFCGIGSIVSSGVTIASDVILGAGTLVIKNINSPGVYIGHPAHIL